jgi:1-acyl-sn-glycerol-3-phosphate acyltransferase
LDNLPKSGPFLMASNHCSHLDPPLLGCRLPHQIRFFARQDALETRLPRLVLTAVGTIPPSTVTVPIIARHEEDHRAPSRRRHRDPVSRGHALDGRSAPARQVRRRHDRLQNSGSGRSRARIFGSFEAFGRNAKIPTPHPVSVRHRPPARSGDYDDPTAGKQRYQLASERIMASIAALELPTRSSDLILSPMPLPLPQLHPRRRFRRPRTHHRHRPASSPAPRARASSPRPATAASPAT